MDAQPPERLKQAAMVQIAVGVVNIFLTSWVAFLAWQSAGCITGTCLTTILGSVGCPLGVIGYCPSCLSWGSFIFVPLGIVDIVSGVLSMQNPKGSAMFMRIAAVVDIVSILLGGIPGAIGGALVMYMLSDPEVKGYLEQQ